MPLTIEEIVNNGMCTGCGVCLSEINREAKMVWNEEGFLTPHMPEPCRTTSATKVCPFNPEPDDHVRDEDMLARVFLKDSSKEDATVGRFENTYAGYSRQFRSTSSSGGVATYIFHQLLSTKTVNHIYAVQEKDGFYEYRLISNVNEVLQTSKTRYYPVTLASLFEQLDTIPGTIAVVGVGCFIKAVRLKQVYYPELKFKIPFLIGIVCGGLKSKFFTDFLAQKAGAGHVYSNAEYRIKDTDSKALDYSFGAFDRTMVFHQVKMANVGDVWGNGLFKPTACDFCTDVMSELADISLGDAWLPEFEFDGRGNSIVITRSKIADQLIKKGIHNKELEVTPLSVSKIIDSQRGGISHRHRAVKFRMKLMALQGRWVPVVRQRLQQRITPLEKIIQLQRWRTRRLSLYHWKATPDLQTFNKKMSFHLLILRIPTKLNHILRKLKKHG